MPEQLCPNPKCRKRLTTPVDADHRYCPFCGLMLLHECRGCGGTSTAQGLVRVVTGVACPLCGLPHVSCSECMVPQPARLVPSQFDCGHGATAHAVEAAPVFESAWATADRTGLVPFVRGWDRPEALAETVRFGESISHPVMRYARLFAIGASGALRAIDLATGQSPVGWDRQQAALAIRGKTADLELQSSSAFLYAVVEDRVELHSVVDGAWMASVAVGRQARVVAAGNWLVAQSYEQSMHFVRAWRFEDLLSTATVGAASRTYVLRGPEGQAPEMVPAVRLAAANSVVPFRPVTDGRGRVLLATADRVYHWDLNSDEPPREWTQMAPSEELATYALSDRALFALMCDAEGAHYRLVRRVWPDEEPQDVSLDFQPSPPVLGVIDDRIVFFDGSGRLRLLSTESLSECADPLFIGQVSPTEKVRSLAVVRSDEGFRVVYLYQRGTAEARIYTVTVEASGACSGPHEVPRLGIDPRQRPAMVVGSDFVVALELEEGIGYVRDIH